VRSSSHMTRSNDEAAAAALRRVAAAADEPDAGALGLPPASRIPNLTGQLRNVACPLPPRRAKINGTLDSGA
jgi:hypothetical protein